MMGGRTKEFMKRYLNKGGNQKNSKIKSNLTKKVKNNKKKK